MPSGEGLASGLEGLQPAGGGTDCVMGVRAIVYAAASASYSLKPWGAPDTMMPFLSATLTWD